MLYYHYSYSYFFLAFYDCGSFPVKWGCSYFVSLLSDESTKDVFHVLDQVSKISRHRSYVVHFTSVESCEIIEEALQRGGVASLPTSNWRTHTWGYAPFRMLRLSCRACLSSTKISSGGYMSSNLARLKFPLNFLWRDRLTVAVSSLSLVMQLALRYARRCL